MTTELVLKQDTRLCHMCWQDAGPSRWTVGHPLFRMLCQACYAPIRAARLNPKPKPVMTCDIPS